MTERESAHPAASQSAEAAPEPTPTPANESPLLDQSAPTRQGDGMEGPSQDTVSCSPRDQSFVL